MIIVSPSFQLARDRHFEMDLSWWLWLENLPSFSLMSFIQMSLSCFCCLANFGMFVADGNRTSDCYFGVDLIRNYL